MIKKTIIGLVLCVVIIGGVFMFNNINAKEIKQLTPNQIDKMIELGIIKVYVNLNHNEEDIDVGIFYRTEQGDCKLYQDIFGRYYCRW